MNNNRVTQFRRFEKISSWWTLLAAMFAALPTVHGAAITITSPVTVSSTVTLAAADTIGTLDISVADSSTLTITRASGGTTNVFPGASLASKTLTMGPNAGGSGRIVFRDITLNQSGVQGAIFAMGANAVVNITGADFINNSSGIDANGVAGVFMMNAAGSRVTLTDVYFEGNYNRGNTGVARVAQGMLTFNDAVFKGNYGRTATGGVLDVRTSGTLLINKGIFDNNRAFTNGGAIFISGGTVAALNDVVFNDNWAGSFGGAIHTNQAWTTTLHMTAGGGTNNYLYSGNLAGAALTTTTTYDSVSNNIAPTAVARAGGFYYSTAASTLSFDIDSGVTLSVGKAEEANKNLDTLASTVATGTVMKSGQGALVLNADNSYWQGAVSINGGTLLLGNADAKLGGNIIVESGAMFGGSGTIQTLLQNGNNGAAKLTAKNGALIQVGYAGDTAAKSLAFARTGANSLVLENGSAVTFDLFGSTGDEGTYDKIEADLLTVGSGTITVTQLGAASSYTLFSSSSLTGNVSDMTLVITSTLASGPRSIFSSNLAKAGQDLVLNNVLSNMALIWTGSTNALWSGANWADVLAAPTETRVATGDSITFDSVSDVTANRSITIGAGGVTVSGMRFIGDADYTFNLQGAGITVDAASAHGAVTGDTGIMEKSGAGTVTFVGAGANTFGGITLTDGRISLGGSEHFGVKLGKVIFGGGAATRPRFIFNEDVVVSGADGAASDDCRLNMPDATAATAKNGGFLMAGWKKLTFENANSISNGGVMFIGSNNNFEIVSMDGGPIEVLFQSNTSAANGGALHVGANSNIVIDNAAFLGNTAGGASSYGGAIYNSGTLTVNMTVSATSSGNSATAGGFLYQAATGITTVNTATNTTLTIGMAADVTKDTIGGLAGSQFNKTGFGDLILNGDSGSHAGIVNVTAGRLLLGGSGAKIGGTINLSSGAVLGGAGTYTGSIVALSGGIIQIGTDNQTGAQTLNLTNSLSLNNGIIKVDLFPSNASDQFNVGSYAGSGNAIDIGTYRTGTFNLGNNLGALASATLTINGFVVVPGARQGGVLSDGGGYLKLVAMAGDNCDLVWTGSASAHWSPADANWSGIFDGKFADADRVTFDNTATVRDIIVDAPMIVGEMVVDTTGAYAFSDYGITGDASKIIGNGVTGTSSKLIKRGSGTLALNNALSTNDFKGGVDLEAGTLEVGAGVVLGSGPLAVKGANTTLRAGGDYALSNAVNFGANSFEIDTQAHAATLSGVISGTGIITKIGSGTLALTGANTYTGTTKLSVGALALGNNTALGASSAKLAINSTSASVVLAAVGLNIANNIDLGAAGNTLTVDTLANTGTLAGVISGAGGIAKTGAGTLVLGGSNTFAGDIDITEGILSAATATAIGQGKLKGSGTLAIATTGNFAFSSGATGGGFTGMVAVNSGKLMLDSTAASVLSAPSATLRIDAGAVTEKSAGAQTIGTLVLNGGRINLPMNGMLPDGVLTVGDLDIGAASQIGVDMAQLRADQANPAVSPALNLLDQDGATTIKLIAATNATGGGSVTITGIDGAAIVPPSIASIKQGADTVAQASYAYAATIINTGTTTGHGIYMGYGLSEINILAGKTLTLDGVASTDKTLSAKLSGTGGLAVGGTVILANVNTYSGATTIAAGSVLRGGVANAFAQSSSIDVKAGATLDLGGFAQTAKNLTGAGLVNMGTVALTATNTADSVFAGNISGYGKVIKTGTAKLSLTGSNAFGNLDIAGGAIGIGNANALGSGAIAVTGSGAKLVADINNLIVSNAVALGANDLVVDAAANSTTLAGVVSGAGALNLQGSGTITLTAANTLTGGLKANAARVIATRPDALGTGPVAIAPTAVLDFRGIASGTISNALGGGGAVELNNSNLYFKGTNSLQRLSVGNGSTLTAGSIGALGGGNSTVTVANNAAITFEVPNTIAKNMNVEAGGKLAFTNYGGRDPMLYVSGSVTLENSSTIVLGSMVSGNTPLIRSVGGIADNGVVLDVGANTELLKWTINNGEVSAAVIQRAANPGKDIAATYDAISAATGAVYSRLSESFLMALVGSQPEGPQNSAWIKGVGTFGDYDADDKRIGYTSDAYGVVAGYDKIISEKLFVGGYVGCLTSTLRTDRSDSDATFPYAGVYGAIRQGAAYLSADVMFGKIDGDTSRYEYTGYATGSYKASTLAGSLELGTVLGVWDRGAIKPAVALHYMDYSYSDHKETGTGAVNLDDLSDNRLESLVSLQITQGFDMPWNKPAMFDMRLGWRAALKDAPLDITGSFASAGGERFAIQGDVYNRSGLMAGLGLRCGLTARSSIALTYDYEMGVDYARHNVNATLRFSW